MRPSVPRRPVIVIWPGKTDGSLPSAVWQMGGCASECAQVSIKPPLPTPDKTRRRAAFLRILPKQAVILLMWFVFNFSYFLLELRKCSIHNLSLEIHVIHLWKLMIFKDQWFKMYPVVKDFKYVFLECKIILKAHLVICISIRYMLTSTCCPLFYYKITVVLV